MLVYECELIETELARSRGNVRRAAVSLGLPERSLWNKLKTHGVEPERFRENGGGIDRMRAYVTQLYSAADRKGHGANGLEAVELAEALFYAGLTPGSPEAAVAAMDAMQRGSVESV